jgi:hypothetical protein
MHGGDNPLFGDEFIKLSFNSKSYFKGNTEVLSNLAVETLGD